MTAPRLSLIIPTYNESANIRPLLASLRAPLSGVAHEVIIVDDDSPDGTWALVESLAKDAGGALRLIRREGKRGLSAAVMDGFAAARGEYLGVMDADLSHDQDLLPRLIAALDGGAEAAIGSRRVPGGGADHWPWHRRLMSNGATLFSRALLGLSIRDLMSGFFVVKRGVYESAKERLHPKGYKIMLDVLVKSGVEAGKVVELPYVFKDRRQGHSKLTGAVALQFLSQNLALAWERWVSRRKAPPLSNC